MTMSMRFVPGQNHNNYCFADAVAIAVVDVDGNDDGHVDGIACGFI